MHEIEIEFKNLITEEEFKNLLNNYPFPKKSTVQTNYYFDTKDFKLKKENMALRIRRKQDQFHLTLKEPHDEGLLETHDQLTTEDAKQWISGVPTKSEHVCKRLDSIHIKYETLLCFGQLITERREIKLEESLFVLDKSTYNHKQDYEVELEVSDSASGKIQFADILLKNKIPKRETPNKIARLFKSL